MKANTSLKRIRKDESGNIALYVAVCLPLVLSLSILGIDISNYQSLKEQAQSKSDEIVVEAARLLPDIAAVETYIVDAVAEESNLSLSRAPEISSDQVSLFLRGQLDSTFDFLLEINGGEGQVFTFEETSTASVVPQDLMLILPDDSSLRPRARDAWGSEDDWPASRYFNFVRAPLLSGNKPLSGFAEVLYWSEWWKEFDSALYRRWATQACYNPVASALKSAAISLLDVAEASSKNRTGLLFTPGDDSGLGYSTAKNLSLDDSGVNFLSHWESESFISNDSCVLFADETESDDTRYALFNTPSYLSSSLADPLCPSIIEKKTWGEPYFPQSVIASCYLSNNLSLRESIYYHAVRDTSHLNDRRNVLEALQAAVLQISQSDSSNLFAVRGNLFNSAVKRIVLLTNAFPDFGVNELRDSLALTQVKGREIEIDIVLFTHQGQSLDAENRLRQTANRLSGKDIANINIHFSEGVDHLLSETMPRLLRKDFEVVLRR